MVIHTLVPVSENSPIRAGSYCQQLYCVKLRLVSEMQSTTAEHWNVENFPFLVLFTPFRIPIFILLSLEIEWPTLEPAVTPTGNER